jgi:uncharacterized protein YfiM (DUF2279 family)
MKKLFISLLLSIPAVSMAQSDSWTSPDKALHFGITAAGVGACSAVTGKTKLCMVGGVLVAVAKEVYDNQNKATNTPSAKDFVAGSVGAIVGAYAGESLRGLIIKPKKRGVFVAYQTEF